MEYFIWANEGQAFWKAIGHGLTYNVHEAHRYTAEEAVRMATAHNSEEVTKIMILKALPEARIDIDAALRFAQRRGTFVDATAPDVGVLDPAFLLWDNTNTGFARGQSFTYRTHRAARYSAADALAAIALYAREDRELLPCRAPPVNVAAEAWAASMRTAAALKGITL